MRQPDQVRGWAAALGCVAALMAARPACADDEPAPRLPTLRVHRGPGAEGCVDAPRLAEAVAKHMRRPAVRALEADEVGKADLDVRLEGEGDSFSARVETAGGIRELHDRGTDCDELAEALSLTLAILLDPELELELPPVPAAHGDAEVAAEPPDPPPDPSVPVVRASVAVDAELERPDAPRPAEPAASPWRLGAHAGVALAAGFVDGPAPAALGELELRLGRFSFGLGALVVPSQRLDVLGGQLDLSMTLATARACFRVLDGGALLGVSLCAQPHVGVIEGRGVGFAPDRAATRPWVGLGAAALGEGSVVGPLGWFVRGALVVPVVRSAFHVDDAAAARPVFEPSPVGALAGAGLSLSIP